MTGSTIGFFHFLESDQKTLRLQAWSTNTLQNMCRAEGKDRHYDVEQAGVWADAVRQRRPIIHNDYASLSNRKGTPDGHAIVYRELVVPIIRDNKVMAILGLGNKPKDYTFNDVVTVSTYADFAWDVIDRKLAENALRQSEEKFRTFVDWTYDWEAWLDPQGNILYTSPSCERITGYKPEEFIADSDLILRIVHPEDQSLYREHQRVIHEGSAGPIMLDYRIIARDGSEHWLEHICRPVFDLDDRYLGRRVSNRDVTQRKWAEQRLSEQLQRERILTETIKSIETDIARDLHDTLGQNITFLRMNLEHLSEAQWGDLAYIRTQIQNMTKAANESYDLIRAMLFILQSGKITDPLNIFDRYARQITERSSIDIIITNQGSPRRISSAQIRQLFYIFREALANIEKYANADRATVEFAWDDQSLFLTITDNGGGFDVDATPSEGHYGLRFMRERAEQLRGSFSIKSVPGEGTVVKVVVPYETEAVTIHP